MRNKVVGLLLGLFIAGCGVKPAEQAESSPRYASRRDAYAGSDFIGETQRFQLIQSDKEIFLFDTKTADTWLWRQTNWLKLPNPLDHEPSTF